MINAGEHKGLKGKVFFADDNIVKVEIAAKNLKIQIPRTLVTEIRDPTMTLEAKNIGVDPLSFDDAAKRDMGVLEGEEKIVADNDLFDKIGGELTPRNIGGIGGKISFCISLLDWGDDYDLPMRDTTQAW